jgi:hypothetical protein
MPRHPSLIAAELSALHQAATLAFVPANVRDALALCVEFCASVAAHLDAAGAIAARPVEPAPAPEAPKLPEVGKVDMTLRPAEPGDARDPATGEG